MTTPPPQNFDQARAQLRQQVADSRKEREALRDTAQSVLNAKGQGRSSDRSVVVTASSDGSITDVVLTDSAMELTPGHLAEELKTAIAGAQKAALEQAAAASGSQLGDDHPLVADLRRSAERFAGPADQLKYQ